MDDPRPLELAEEWLALLQANGYRLTAPRKAVVEVVATSQHILNPLEVFERGRNIYPGLGLVTVYRTIEKLEELGVLQRAHLPSGCQGFIAASEGHNHMLICTRCGRVQYFSGEFEKIDELMEGVQRESGYRVQDHWLQLFGLCKICAS